jgi:hypothetical protein
MSKPTESELSTAEILEYQWLTPLDGPRVSPEILRRLVKPTNSNIGDDVVRANGPFNSLIVRSEVNSETAASAAGSWSDRDPQDFVSRKFEGIFPERRGRQFIPELERDIPARSAESSITDFQARRSSSNFSPPSVTPSLPPLLPAVSPGSPTLPLASATSRYGAWRGEVDAPETDLSLLAAQMKRILDEEARRHGIDV